MLHDILRSEGGRGSCSRAANSGDSWNREGWGVADRGRRLVQGGLDLLGGLDLCVRLGAASVQLVGGLLDCSVHLVFKGNKNN